MIEDLKWTSLQDRRKTARLMMLYRIHSNIIATDGIKNKLQPPSPRQQRRHNMQFSQPHWNDLPQEVIEAKTIDTFVQTAVIQNK